LRESFLWLLGVIWLGTVAAGFGAWERFERTPGESGMDGVAKPTSGWQLHVFVHPRCPCSRATLEALREIRSAAPELGARVVFVRPAGVEENWELGDSWEAARRMSGVEVVADPDGAEARRFGAKTSGQAVLIDPSGRAAFRGGLTRGRGTPGESLGQVAVLQWIREGRGSDAAPVYGCPLFTPND
jgi:hypothetical protein